MQRINKWKPNQVGSFGFFVDDFDAIEAIDRFTNKQVPHSIQNHYREIQLYI
jgi:hypothetical protein